MYALLLSWSLAFLALLINSTRRSQAGWAAANKLKNLSNVIQAGARSP